jgi:uncharacterized membrane protein
VAVLILYLTLPPRLEFGPEWLLPVLVLVVLIPLLIFSPNRHQETPTQRAFSVGLIALVNFFNLISVVRLIIDILHAHVAGIPQASGQQLFVAGAQVWATNILVYAMWFWEIDGGGPEERAHTDSATDCVRVDFLFPQMQLSNERRNLIEKQWKPLFVDYLYLAFTNALAFSPTDAMPVSRMAKMIMLCEAITSFATIAVVVSRGIGIIS